METTPNPHIEELLARPDSERLREFKYRFAQATVFGLPVFALAFFGQRLGGDESARWIGLLQTLLSGWVVYVAAAGMLFEGAILLSRSKLTPSFLIALIVTIVYLYSAFTWVMSLIRGHYWPTTPQFHIVVILMILWTGLQWARLSRRS